MQLPKNLRICRFSTVHMEHLPRKETRIVGSEINISRRKLEKLSNALHRIKCSIDGDFIRRKACSCSIIRTS